MGWMRRCGDLVTITISKYASHTGTVESDVLANVYDVMLDTEELVTVRWDQVRGCADEP